MKEIIEDFKLAIPSNPKNVRVVEPFIDSIKKRFKIREELFGNMLIAVTEAVNNAIIHGNKSDETKTVELSLELEKKTKSVVFRVWDKGAGFDYNNLPDPTAPENLEKTTGRGVFLMEHLADLVIFSNSGSRVEIQFKI